MAATNKPATIDDVLVAVQALQGTIERLENRMKGGHVEDLKAYDRPEIPEDQAVADGSVNPDGSIWTLVKFDRAPGQSEMVALPEPRKERQLFGYISPTKTPKIWEMGKALLGDQQFARWEAGWRRNPYAIYKTTPEIVAATGAEVNTVLFSYLTQPTTSYVQ